MANSKSNSMSLPKNKKKEARNQNAISWMAGKSKSKRRWALWTSVKCTFIMFIVESALEQLEQKAYLTQ